MCFSALYVHCFIIIQTHCLRVHADITVKSRIQYAQVCNARSDFRLPMKVTIEVRCQLSLTAADEISELPRQAIN